ncbi:hypothetical protein [Bacillus thuringiensis]|uniref:hypothetical protein n=1 Tax=Bacillus thuringiensis TaxID=1428 RepID=UPI000BFB2C64|nr:hypothetical protein [Bacillus thuringiensis]PGT90011.1 hypothetical protein COD17_09685 [Bacillus thuringiensis]
MRTLYLLGKALCDFSKKKDLIKFYLTVLMASYGVSIIAICLAWYVYEWAIIGHLEQNKSDTVLALSVAFVIMIPIADLCLERISKTLGLDKKGLNK